MLFFTFCIALIFIAQVSAFSAFPTIARKQSSLNMAFGNFFGKPKPKAAASAPTSKPGSISVKSATAAAKKTEKGKDMTWGGRPDPSPEAFVDEDADFFSAAWRFGKKK